MHSVSLNASSFEAAAKSGIEKLPNEILRALERTAQMAAGYAKAGLQYNHRTYGLRNSITWGAQLGSGRAAAVVRASSPHAAFVEYGTRAHVIAPRRKTALRFVQNGATRFARIVYHPGTAPRRFMQFAQERSTPLLERLMGEAVVRALL